MRGVGLLGAMAAMLRLGASVPIMNRRTVSAHKSSKLIDSISLRVVEPRKPKRARQRKRVSATCNADREEFWRHCDRVQKQQAQGMERRGGAKNAALLAFAGINSRYSTSAGRCLYGPGESTRRQQRRMDEANARRLREKQARLARSKKVLGIIDEAEPLVSKQIAEAYGIT